MQLPLGYSTVCWLSTRAPADAIAAVFKGVPPVHVALVEPTFAHILFHRDAWAVAHLREADARARIHLALKTAPFAFDLAIGTYVVASP